MKSRTMEGGYVAEDMESEVDLQGGQLRAINGQKYILNPHKEGYFITKGCAIILASLAIVAMVLVFLVTYFLVIPSCPATYTPVSNENISIAHASVGSRSQTDAPYQNDRPSSSDIDVTTTTTQKILSTESTTTTTTAEAPLPTTKCPYKCPPPVVVNPDDENKTTYDEKELTDTDLNVVPINDTIVFHEGWSPYLYKLIIEPNFETYVTNGSVEIFIMNDLEYESLNPIVLDIQDMDILKMEAFELIDNKFIPIESSSIYGDDNETYVIELDNGIKSKYFGKAGDFKIKLDFAGILSSTLVGFYKVAYKHYPDEDESILASTQFSPVEARRAFPCFDRPDKKAQFEISLVRDANRNQTVLSNMPSTDLPTFHRPNYILESFEKTPKMSTYLVAFTLSDLVRSNVIKSNDLNLPTINFWTRKEVSRMTDYAHQITVDSLKYLQDYFGIRYKLPKIDMVAIPNFGFSAMENWGLITFRESSLLVPTNMANESSADHTERVASVIAHEISHQWFGNLVTMKWWDDLWLKEGFAVYMSYQCLNHIEPAWRSLDKFTIAELQRSMDRDSDESSHAISAPVVQKSDIRRIFDPISYSKGAVIIRMMKSFLGEAAFKAGITEYLKKFEYSNAVQDDLWSIMTEKGHTFKTLPYDLNVKDIMDTWTRQSGYPIINVTRLDNDLIITQHRFNLPKIDPNDNTKWFVPITYATGHERTVSEIPSYWLTNTQDKIIIADVNMQKTWMYVDINRNGYFRVNYDMDSWKQLSAHYPELPEIIRGKIIDDSLNLARIQQLNYDIPLTFLIRMRSTPKDYLAWSAASQGLQYLTYMLAREPIYELYKASLRHIYRAEYDRVGFVANETETHVQLMHRSSILAQTCLFGYDRCTNEAQLLYRSWMVDSQNKQVNPNLKGTIYCVALREGGPQEWYYALKRYKETTNAGEKELILNALGCTQKPFLLSKYLNMTIDPSSGIQKQDGARAFGAVAANNIGYEIAFDFLMTNIKEINDYFGEGFSTLTKMVDSVTTYMNKEYQLEQFEKFEKKAKQLGYISIEKSIRLAKIQVKNNIYWRSNAYYNLEQFLKLLVEQLHINVY